MTFTTKILLKRLIILLLCVFGQALPLVSQEKLWNAGVATKAITPEMQLWMGGYALRDHPAEGTMHDLWVKALAIEDSQGARAVFVSTDLLGLPRNISEAVTTKLQRDLKLERSQIMLTSSHTHSGPVLSRSLQTVYPYNDEQVELIEEYSSWLESQIIDAVTEAFDELEPASLFVGNGVTRLAVNRRNNSEEEILVASELKGPIDHSVPVLKVQRPDGAPLAIVFGYACHATTLDGYDWSGDFPGFAQIEIENRYPGATSLFFAGCGGDQNPLPRRSVSLAQQYGQELAGAVQRVLTDSMTQLDPYLNTTYREINLDFADFPTEEELSLIAESELEYYQRWADVWLKRMKSGQAIPTSYPYYPIQSWRLGNQTWVALGGEVVVDYAIDLKRLLGQDLFVTAYANDVMAYIPSVRVLREGGYEGNTSMRAYGLPSTWAPEIEQKIIHEVHRQVTELRSKQLDK